MFYDKLNLHIIIWVAGPWIGVHSTWCMLKWQIILFILSLFQNKKIQAANNWAIVVVKVIEEVRTTIQDSNMKYKSKVDIHKCSHTFQRGELVIVWLRKESLPSWSYSKLSPQKLEPFVIANDKSYVVDLCLPFTWWNYHFRRFTRDEFSQSPREYMMWSI